LSMELYGVLIEHDLQLSKHKLIFFISLIIF
jgi:hypothetical protein